MSKAYVINSDGWLVKAKCSHPDSIRIGRAKNIGGRIEPIAIVLHFTASPLTKFASADYLASNDRNVSAHFVVERDGTVTQLVDCDSKANHAGESVYKGRKYCNGFTIGIEIVNPGRLVVSGDKAKPWFSGTTYSVQEYGIVQASSKHHGNSGYWMPDTEEQLEAVEGLIRAIKKAYPTVNDVVGHHDISPGRKDDPTPLMPWGRMKAALVGSAAEDDVSNFERENERKAAMIRRAQERLTELLFYSSAIDGMEGPNTRSAVRDFQDQNKLPITNGSITPEVMASLNSPSAKPAITAERTSYTAKDLSQAGSAQVATGQTTSMTGKITAAIGAAGTTASMYEAVTEGVDKAEDALRTAERVKDVAERSSGFYSILGKVLESPITWFTVCLMLVGVIVWMLGNSQIKARLRAFVNGQKR